MKEQLMELMGVALGAALVALVTAAVAWLRAHVQNKVLAAVLDAVVKGVEDGGHAETKKAIEVTATAKGVQGHLDELVQKTVEGSK